MLRFLENYIDTYKAVPVERPATTLRAFYWHYVRQIWPLFAAVMLVGIVVTAIEVALFAYLGELVDLMRKAESPAAFLHDNQATLIWMAFVAMVARPIALFVHTSLVNQGIVPAFTNLVRWQTHRYVLRQSLNFFSNDFAGRIANKIMQTGPALRESVVQVVDAMWFVALYTLAALVLFLDSDWRLTIPLALWICAFVAAMVYFVPRVKNGAAEMSEMRSLLTGRIVDSYTNILTVKLFAHTDKEEAYAREALTDQERKLADLLREITWMEVTVYTLNGVMIVGTAGLAIWLWGLGVITLGAIALSIGLVIRINNMAGWVMWVVTGIFENVGTVQEGMETISKPLSVVDAPNARPLAVEKGEILFDRIHFHYGKDAGVIEDLSLAIRAGEKVGLVGRSGAGKSTLVNLLLRFYDLEAGRILIDGADIAKVGQDSLRSQIGMVTQDTSLLHRSVMDNILYGRPGAGEEEAVQAAIQAHAEPFIGELEDRDGRKGYAAHVGERGVKLSGGQRQRIAIARVLLKNAPILVLDEATSALDSEVEAAIQESLYELMQGKTVIAIAHRLSTIAAMDRLVVMDQGRIIEEGSHRELISRGGVYAGLWERQSGGFLAHEAA